MKNFAAIDCETANQYRAVCSVGVVVVRDGVVVDRIYKLIRPEPNFYCSWATDVHGLTRSDTNSAASFDAVWAEIAPKIAGLPLVAHNSPFDEGCLQAAHRTYAMAYPDYEFHCTYRAARRAFGAALENHQLHTVAAHCGFELKEHHHALADAEACAMIALKVL